MYKDIAHLVGNDMGTGRGPHSGRNNSVGLSDKDESIRVERAKN